MKRSFVCVAAMVVAAFAVGSAVPARAQQSRKGTVIVPSSNVVPPQDRGTHAHTNFLIFVPSKGGHPAGLVGPSPAGETPSSLACVYQVGPNNTNTNCPVIYSKTIGVGSPMNYDTPANGSNVIAIVDAYDYPTAASDFATFSAEFGLPSGSQCGDGTQPCFTKVYASGSQPRSNGGWAQEEALDIEWAHAMAPKAQIVLVEAATNKNSDLYQAVSVANSYIASHGGKGEVSMSWGGSESASETTNDTNFTQPGVTYFAASGDSGGQVIYPSASPYVISAGGTTVNRNSSGDFTGETTWSSAGGGASKYEAMPGYQKVTQDINTTGNRGTPDISFDANPATGVSVYDSTASQGLSGWLVFGGTSVASPSLAGIVNNAGAFDGGWDGGSNLYSVQSNLYSNYAADASSTTNPTKCSYNSSTPFYDITGGSAGPCWDFASGIGTLRGPNGPVPFSISALPTSLSVTQGSSDVTSAITVNPGFYTGTVYLTANQTTGTGLSVSIIPNTVSSSNSWTSTLTVGAGTAAAGTYTVTVAGAESNGGTPVSSTTVTVTVSGTPPPQAPTNLQASATSGQVSLTWTGSSGATAYYVFRSTTKGGENLSGTPLATTSSTSYNDTSVASGTTYYYEVEAHNSNGTSGPSNEASATTPGSTPNFTVRATSFSVTRGSSVETSVSVAPLYGFTGNVTLSVSGLPGNDSDSFSPNPVTISGTTAVTPTLTVTASPHGPAKTYTLTITGTSGSLSNSINVTLTVN